MKNVLPILIFCLLSVIALSLWQNEKAYYRERALRHTETSTEQIRIRMEGLMKARMASLELLAARWVERTPPDFSRMRFFQFAEALYTYYPGFTAINWIDPTGVIQWVFPLENDTLSLNRNVNEHEGGGLALTFARAKGDLTPAITPSQELSGGGIGFHIFIPLIHMNKIQGFLDGVFQLAQIVSVSLAKDVLDDFWVRIYEGERLVYANGESEIVHPDGEGLGAVRTVRFHGKVWKLNLEPKGNVHMPPPGKTMLFLVFGLSISAALSLLLYFLLMRIQMVRNARDRALFEVGERERAQETLRENEKKLEALIDEIAAKNAELETFVYSVSHDLKTPIVTIEGFVGVLREDFGPQLTEDGERYLSYMSEASKKMELLINDLLELSRVGRLQETRGEFSMSDLLEEIMVTLSPQASAKGVTVNIQEGLPVVYGERKRLIQVMENLLSNAIKYMGRDNPSPRIDVGCQNQDGRDVFFVRDNGIGIQERFFEKIFQVFQRLPEAKKIEEGTGVGLTTVKRIIEHHGGRIWLTSKPGEGTTFFFTLNDKEA